MACHIPLVRLLVATGVLHGPRVDGGGTTSASRGDVERLLRLIVITLGALSVKVSLLR